MYYRDLLWEVRVLPEKQQFIPCLGIIDRSCIFSGSRERRTSGKEALLYLQLHGLRQQSSIICHVCCTTQAALQLR